MIVNLRKHIIEAQSLFGFIDDLVHIDFTNKSRTNYQAKNSDSSTADWTEEISNRVKYQIKKLILNFIKPNIHLIIC